MLRAFLTSEFPRDNKCKNWEITTALAKKIERDYKAKIKVKEKTIKIETLIPNKRCSHCEGRS